MGTSALRKAAVVMSSLPRDCAGKLLGRLDPSQAAAVGAEIARLDNIDAAEQAAALRAFAVAAGEDESRRENERRPFRFLHAVKPKALADLLGDERPTTIALVLSHLPAELAADALDAMPPERQTAIVRCLAEMEPPDKEIVREVEAAVERRLSGNDGAGGIAAVVKMLGAMRPAGERRLLGELAEADPELLHRIRRKMFGPDVAALASGEALDAA